MDIPTIAGYKLQECRGRGAFGSVWSAVWNGEFECAVKALTPGAWHPHYLGWCLEKLRIADRPGIVKVYSYDLSQVSPHLSMVLLPPGVVTMEQIAGRLPAAEAWPLLDALSETLAWLHGEGIVHTGLSAQNVFVASGPDGQPVVMVSDVGQGWLSECPTHSLHHQLAYIPPEHWRGATQILREGKGQPRDVYAFGMLAWRLLTGGWPRGSGLLDGVRHALETPLTLEPVAFANWIENEVPNKWHQESKDAAETARRLIVEKCLSFSVEERYPSMLAVRDALAEHLMEPKTQWARDRVPTGQTVPLSEKALTATVPLPGEPAVVTPPPLPPPPDTSEAFEKDAVLPSSRRFSLSLPRLSLKLQRRRAEEVLPGQPSSLDATPGRLRKYWLPTTAAAAMAATAFLYVERRQNIEDLSAAADMQVGVAGDLTALTAKKLALAQDHAELEKTLTSERNARTASAEELLRQAIKALPVDEGQLEGWRAAMRPMAASLASALHVGSESEPTSSTVQNIWLLASLKHYLGDSDGARALLDDGIRDLEAASVNANGRLPEDMGLQFARIQGLTGSILSNQKRFADALPHLSKASASYNTWIEAHPEDNQTRQHFAENLLLEGKALLVRGDRERARGTLIRIPALIPPPVVKAGALEKPVPADELFVSADYNASMGQLYMAMGNYDNAISEMTTALNALIAFEQSIAQTDPQSLPCRLRIARLYVDLGRSLTAGQPRPGEDNLKDSDTALKEAVDAYNDLNRERPFDVSIKTELAAASNQIAELLYQTKTGVEGAKESLDYQNDCLALLRELNDLAPLDNTIRHHLGSAIILNGELQAATGNINKGLNLQSEASALLNELLGEITLSESGRRDALLLVARSHKAAGGIHEKAKRVSEAILAYGKALAAAREASVQGEPEPAISAAIEASLKKLKPQG